MKYELQLQARKLRCEGKSINLIAKQLGVSKSSVSLWVKDINLTEEQKIKLTEAKSYNFKYGTNETKKQNALNQRQSFQEIGKLKANEKNLLHCMGCMLFWAEGSKHKNKITFTNSDVNMMKLFVKFLKESLQVQNEQISILINCYLHEHKEIEKVNNFWIQELDLEGAYFIKPTIKITQEPINNNGVCSITVHSTKLAQQLYGAIQEYAGFDNGLCLENKRSRKLNKS
jgi:predicted transcriptional regulator